MAIVVPILTEYSNRGMQQAFRDIRQADDKFAAFGKVASTAFLGAAAAAGAFAVAVGVDAVKAAAEDEEAVRGLSKTLENIGFGDALTDVEKFITGLQETTGVADTEMRPAFERLVRSTRDVGEAQRLLGIAIDASAASGKSLSAVSNALGKAYDGNLTSLSRLGLGIDAATLKTGDMVKITGELARLTSGQASAAAKTFAGQMRILNVAVDEAKEKIGYSLIGAFERLNKTLGGTTGTASAIGGLSDAISESIDNAGFLIAKLAELGKWLKYADVNASNLEDSLISGFGPIGDIANSLKDLVTAWRQSDDAAAAAASNAYAYAGAWDSVAVAAMRAANASYAAAVASQAERATAASTSRWTALARDYGKTISRNGGNLNEYIASLHNVNRATTGSSSGTGSSGAVGATKELTKAQKALQKQYDATSASIDDTRSALDAAQGEIDAALSALNDYATGYREWLMSAVSLSAAVDLAASDAGKEAGISWIDGFYAQFEDVDRAAKAMEALRKALNPLDTRGNEMLVAQLMTLPPAEAAKIATEIVDKGIGPELAAKLSTYDLFAAQAGVTWAGQFYQAGVNAAYAQYNGIAETLTSKLGDLYALGQKMGKAVADGYNSVAGGVTSKGSKAGASTYSGQTVNVTVQAGVGDPVAIARTIEQTLRSARLRTGVV